MNPKLRAKEATTTTKAVGKPLALILFDLFIIKINGAVTHLYFYNTLSIQFTLSIPHLPPRGYLIY